MYPRNVLSLSNIVLAQQNYVSTGLNNVLARINVVYAGANNAHLYKKLISMFIKNVNTRQNVVVLGVEHGGQGN